MRRRARGQHRAHGAGTCGGRYQKLAPTLIDFGDGIAGRVIAHFLTSGSNNTPARVGAKCAAARPREAAHYTHADQR